MTREELVEFGRNRYGRFWIGLLAAEIGCDQSALWRIANGQKAVSDWVVRLVSDLPPKPPEEIASDGCPWVDVPNTGGEFQATAAGSLRRVKMLGQPFRGRVLKAHVNKNGYAQVAITVNSKKKWIPVHRLIAETFIGPRSPGMQIDHIDGNKLNNAASNLEYVTGSENMRRAYRLGLVRLCRPPTQRLKPMILALRVILDDPDNILTDKSRRAALDALAS